LEPSASELYGYSREEAVGRVSHELLRTEFPSPLERITEQLHQDNRWTANSFTSTRNGSRIVVRSRWTLDRDDGGNRKRVLETNNDINPTEAERKSIA